MIGVVVYAAVDIVLQLLPPHYSPIADAESNLAVGTFGWIMSINFFGRGVTSAAAIVSLALTAPRTRLRDVGLTLFAIAGFCSALIAFFPTDIPLVSGEGITAGTVHGTVHLIGATSGFLFALAAFWVLTAWIYRSPQLVRLRRGASVFLAIASIGLVFLGVTIVATPALLGLAERICLVGILGWVFVVAATLRQAQGTEFSVP
jgi:hypothetical membrane protein